MVKRPQVLDALACRRLREIARGLDVGGLRGRPTNEVVECISDAFEGQLAGGDARHGDLKPDSILANHPNIFDWGGGRLAGDELRQYGPRAEGTANVAVVHPHR